MEQNKKTPPLFLLLPLLLVCRSHACPSLPDNLTCYNDYNQNITCMWNSTYVSDRTDTTCTIHAKLMKALYRRSSASCHLDPADTSRPALKKCSLIFKTDYTFQVFSIFSLNLSCNHAKQSIVISYQPSCHVKVNPPGKPEVNFTTVSWLSQVTENVKINSYRTELQWKQKDQSWRDPAVQKKTGIQCEHDCSAELDPDLLIQDERYEAHVRVQSIVGDREGAWSDWSPTASWLSPVGKIKPPSGIAVPIIVAGVVLLLAVVLFSTNKTWVYTVKRIKGPPIPDPGKSFLQNVQSGFGLHFPSESFHSFLKPVEIITVELTSTVDAVAPCRPEEKMMMNKGNCDSTSSSFSNPSYSELCTPPISSLTAGNLKPCAADTPYGPVGTQGEGKSPEQESNEEREKENEMLKLFLKGSRNSDPVQVISDYEKSEKLNIDRFRLQSLDSGMCSCEEVSEESMEADSINMTASHDEEPEGEEEKEGGNEKQADLQKLFGSSGGMFGKFIQVCSDYERVEMQQADSPELPSLDSGVSSGGEEQVSQEESMEDDDKSTESTHFLFPPHPSSVLPCSLLSFPQLPLNLSGPGFTPALQLQPSHMLEGFALMSTGRSVEPSVDGYMPVKQEES